MVRVSVVQACSWAMRDNMSLNWDRRFFIDGQALDSHLLKEEYVIGIIQVIIQSTNELKS